MQDINVTLGFDEESFELISEKVIESMDINDKIDDRIGNYDYEAIISDWFSYYAEIDDKITDAINEMDLTSCIDASELNIESNIIDLLESYNPDTSCVTGAVFTIAVNKAICYLLQKDNLFVQDIAQAVNEYNQNIEKEKIKSQIMDEVRNDIIEQFKKDLEKYAKDVENEKENISSHQITTRVVQWSRDLSL